MKNTGNDSDSAAKASVLISPAQYVSTKLYIVLKKNPTLAGTAIRRVNSGIGSEVRDMDMRTHLTSPHVCKDAFDLFVMQPHVNSRQRMPSACIQRTKPWMREFCQRLSHTDHGAGCQDRIT